MAAIRTRYAASRGLDIAYQQMGEHGPAIIILPGMVSHVELLHDFPGYTAFLRRLARFARVITFDKRGQGLSDGFETIPTLEERVEDAVAVMDEVGADTVVPFGFSEGGPMALKMAQDLPGRVEKFILFGAYAKATGTPAYPHMKSEAGRRQALQGWLADWGMGGGAALELLAPQAARDELMQTVFARIERYAATPNAMRRYFEANFTLDVLDILPRIKQPALVLHRDDDRQVPVTAGHHLADALANGLYRDAGSGGHLFWYGDTDGIVDEVQAFVCGPAYIAADDTDRELTVLFSDIVASTSLQTQLGDSPWRDLLDRHDEIASQLTRLNGGRQIKSTGDGILAVFEKPAGAVEAALQMVEQMAQLGLQLRLGLNYGRVELRGDDVGGSAVNAAARIERLAEPGQVLVSKSLADELAGVAGVSLTPAGKHTLKGLDGEWALFRAER